LSSNSLSLILILILTLPLLIQKMPPKRASKKPAPASSRAPRMLDTDDEGEVDMAQELRVMEENLRRSMAVDVSKIRFLALFAFASQILVPAFNTFKRLTWINCLPSTSRPGFAKNRSKNIRRRSSILK
jgi:hypothetical protein